jgi:subtilase family serine protease
MIGMTAIAAAGSAGAASGPVYSTLPGSVAPFVASAPAVSAVPGSTRLTIQLWLKPSIAAATRYATAVSTPGGSLFHQYLTPDQYTARYGPTAAQAQAVSSWLRSEGFTGVRIDPQRAYVRATGSVAAIDSALKTQIDVFRSSQNVNAGRFALHANDRAVSLPSTLTADVIGVTGLDNAAAVSTLDRDSALPAGAASGSVNAPSTGVCSSYYGQHRTTGLPEQFGTTSFPTEVCGYSASQIRAAYGATSANTGVGQTVALVELGLTKDMFLTLQDYAAANHMPAPSLSRYTELSLGQGDACGDPFDVEEQLDVESAYDMAPAAHELVVGGDSCNDGDFGLQGLFDADQAVLGGSGSHPLATIVSNSWEGGLETQPAVLTNIEHAFLVRAAAEGVGMYFSSGDGSGVEAPSSDPFATAVGGTTLGIGATDNRLFETGWSTGVSLLAGNAWLLFGEQGAAGGGPSLLWSQPAYQKGVVPSSMSTVAGDRGGPVRSAPDISADADPFTGFSVGLLRFAKGKAIYHQGDIGGTSLASPLVAGMIAAAQQGQAKPFGFLNPVFYKLVNTSALNEVLPLTSSSPALYRGTACDALACGARILTTFDDQSDAMFGYTGQISRSGYSNMSGVGTPHGLAFIQALRARG